jgi:hypothetical protein
MYYKIENKDCEVYNKLHALRTKEIQMEEDNLKAVNEKVGLEFNLYLGRKGQQNFNRVTSYSGFCFLKPEKVDLKIWKEDKFNPGCFIPNRKTKSGREMAQFLNNGLKGHWFGVVYDALGLKRPLGKFSFPFIDICADVSGETIIMHFGNEVVIDDENIIEITSKEFEILRTINIDKRTIDNW